MARPVPPADVQPLSPLVALLYLALGPAGCCGGPLRGTRWDPGLRQQEDLRRRAERRARAAARRHVPRHAA